MGKSTVKITDEVLASLLFPGADVRIIDVTLLKSFFGAGGSDFIMTVEGPSVPDADVAVAIVTVEIIRGEERQRHTVRFEGREFFKLQKNELPSKA